MKKESKAQIESREETADVDSMIDNRKRKRHWQDS